MNTTIDLTAIATSRVPGLCWDPVHGLYRCPTCRRPPQNLRLGADAVFLCSDCATYWPTTERHGIWDHDATTAEHRDHGCLDATDHRPRAIRDPAKRAVPAGQVVRAAYSPTDGPDRSTTSNSNSSDISRVSARMVPCAASRP